MYPVPREVQFRLVWPGPFVSLHQQPQPDSVTRLRSPAGARLIAGVRPAASCADRAAVMGFLPRGFSNSVEWSSIDCKSPAYVLQRVSELGFRMICSAAPPCQRRTHFAQWGRFSNAQIRNGRIVPLQWLVCATEGAATNFCLLAILQPRRSTRRMWWQFTFWSTGLKCTAYDSENI